MSLLDVKYVVTVEFINENALPDSRCFFTTEATYAAELARSFQLSKKIVAYCLNPPHQGSLQEWTVRQVTYGPL